MLKCAIALLLVCSNAFADCAAYNGMLVELVDGPPYQNITSGMLGYFCDNVPECDDGNTHFEVGGVFYSVPHADMRQVSFNDARCTFYIAYTSDEIFSNGFED